MTRDEMIDTIRPEIGNLQSQVRVLTDAVELLKRVVQNPDLDILFSIIEQAKAVLKSDNSKLPMAKVYKALRKRAQTRLKEL